ncbi:spore cortex biosynthesis protein YabQ [Acididesulfobacillus acetoxydans]|uniref:spore cortex biosynthesis protein YabQ n=1 Tax=Acididesulfobacillus acetoxydans TaxID=1561005 RepID=UPI0021C1080B|nr:spore cortex biosynthesis protein YabQ [Acididesulfobacillus acetoxydans]
MSDFSALAWVLLSGMFVGFVFDWYRTLRRWRGWGPALTFAGDILFSSLALLLLAFFLQRANFLAFRLYAFIGVVVGLLLYLRILSRKVTHFALRSYGVFDGMSRLVGSAIAQMIGAVAWLMHPFYEVLSWLSILLYRFGQAVFLEAARSGRRKAASWWEEHFPPHRDG